MSKATSFAVSSKRHASDDDWQGKWMRGLRFPKYVMTHSEAGNNATRVSPLGRSLPFKNTAVRPQQYPGQADQLRGVLIAAIRIRRSTSSVCALESSILAKGRWADHFVLLSPVCVALWRNRLVALREKWGWWSAYVKTSRIRVRSYWQQ
jgi:hypothetical protein